MEKEISSGTMLGIVLIALAAVIGLGFGVFSIAKSVANEGTVEVQSNLEIVSQSAYEDYNDKIVTGTMVKSALTTFAGTSVAILINTTAMNADVVTYVGHEYSYVWQFLGNSYINYNALLGMTDSASLNMIDGGYPVTSTYQVSLTMPSGYSEGYTDGAVIVSNTYLLDEYTGKVMYDNTLGGMSRTGNCEYISASAKFEANLIKDVSGEIVGIMFAQMSN